MRTGTITCLLAIGLLSCGEREAEAPRDDPEGEVDAIAVAGEEIEGILLWDAEHGLFLIECGDPPPHVAFAETRLPAGDRDLMRLLTESESGAYVRGIAVTDRNPDDPGLDYVLLRIDEIRPTTQPVVSTKGETCLAHVPF